MLTIDFANCFSTRIGSDGLDETLLAPGGEAGCATTPRSCHPADLPSESSSATTSMARA